MSVDKSLPSPLCNMGSPSTVVASPSMRPAVGTDVTPIGSTVPPLASADRRTGDTSPPKMTGTPGDVNLREGSIMDSLTGELNNYAQTASHTISDFFGMYFTLILSPMIFSVFGFDILETLMQISIFQLDNAALRSGLSIFLLY